MHIRLPLLTCLILGATGAGAEVSEEETTLIYCTANALMLSGTLADMVEFGMDLPEGLAEGADARAVGLLQMAEPLFDDEVGGNAVMNDAVEAAHAARAEAREADTTGEWFRGLFDDVDACATEFLIPADADQ